MKKTALLSVSALALGTAAFPATSHAGATGNIGFVTDYIFRGIFQSASSAYAGADYSGDHGVYVGTWWADVNQGTETDIYAGWMGGSDKVKFKVGYTGYRYLDDFDGNYDEINLGLYAGIFSSRTRSRVRARRVRTTSRSATTTRLRTRASISP